MNKVLRAKDISEILGCGLNKVYALMKSESFPTIKIGRNYFVYENEFEKWLQLYSYKEYIL